MKLAGFRCGRCAGKRSLEVHHRTYDRLGWELDEDLEVLCGTCHADHHIAEVKETPQGVYLKLASEALTAQPFARVSDLSDLVKTRCAKLKIRYDAHAIDRAINLLCGGRLKNPQAVDTAVQFPAKAEAVLSHDEAMVWLRRLGLAPALSSLVRTMPEAAPSRINIYGPIPHDEVEHDRY